MSNDIKFNVVSSEDLLKASYEDISNGKNILVGYDAGEKGGMLSNYVYDAINLDSNNVSTSVSFTDESGASWLINDLHYYTFNNKNELVSLTIEELKQLLTSNDDSSSIIVSKEELSSSTISSDLDYVTDAMNSLVAYINPDGELEYYSQAGDAGLYGAMYDATNYYKGINNTLYSLISAEASTVSTIAYGYEALDKAAQEQAITAVSSPDYSGYHSSSGSSKSSQSSTVQGMTAGEILSSTQGLIDQTRSAATSTKYNKVSTFLGENIQPGKVGKINVSNLTSTMNNVISTLEQDAQTCTDMIESIDSFTDEIKSNGKLKGESWKKVKGNLKTYKSLLNASIDAAEFLANVMETAKLMIEEFLYPDTELDDSKLPELEEKLKEIKALIAELLEKISQMIASQREVCDYEIINLSKKKKYEKPTNCHLEPTDEEIAEIKSSITMYEEQEKELEKEIKRLKEFAIVVNEAQKLIDDAIDQVKNTFENPTKDKNGNYEFNSNYALDLSAYGLAAGTASGDFLSEYMDAIKGNKSNKSYNPDEILRIGATQLGKRYHSMHYDPVSKSGFGCAMFVAYCFNEYYFPGRGYNAEDKNTPGFYGGCKDFFGNVTTDDYDPRNKGFIEVDPKDRQKGDVVCFVTARNSEDIYGNARNCFHVGIYTGEGDEILHSSKNGVNGVGYCTIDEYKQAKINSLDRKYNSGNISEEDARTRKAIKEYGDIQVVYLRYVGTEETQQI